MTPEQLRRLHDNLPAQPCLLGLEDYRSTAVLMLLLLLDGEYHFVLQERHPEIPQGGEICFPGGLFDPDHDADTEQTAIRETVEELGIPQERIAVVGALGTLVTSMGATVDAYVGIGWLKGLEELRINGSEVNSVFTVPVSYFENTPPEEYKTVVREHPTCVDERTGHHSVPGWAIGAAGALYPALGSQPAPDPGIPRGAADGLGDHRPADLRADPEDEVSFGGGQPTLFADCPGRR